MMTLTTIEQAKDNFDKARKAYAEVCVLGTAKQIVRDADNSVGCAYDFYRLAHQYATVTR